MESHFYQLDQEEFLAKVPLLVKEAAELRSWQARLGIADEDCLCSLEEISLAEEERAGATEIYFHLPADERLPHAYRQPIAVKIIGEGVRFAQDYDYSPTFRSRQLPHGFLLKRALSAQEKSSNNRLRLSANFSGNFVSLNYVPGHSWSGEAGPTRLVLILHQICGPGGQAAGTTLRQVQESGERNVGIPEGIPEVSWNSKEPVLDSDPLASIPSFFLETPLEGRPTAEIPHIALKLEDGQLQNLNGSPFEFPIGEHILDIRLDGVTFPVFWHQKTDSPPYRVFFFNGAGVLNDGQIHFGRMTYFRFLDISGGCMCDAAFPVLFSGYPKDQQPPMASSWYLGTAAENFHPKFAQIILTLTEVQHIPESNVLLMGDSMGGFMALKMAEYLPYAHAFAANSQVDFLTYNSQAKGLYNPPLLYYLVQSTDPLYLSPELRNRMIVDTEKCTNSQRIILYIQNKPDTHHYSKHFLPFLHWTRQNPQTRDLLFYHISPGELKIPPLHQGVNAIEFSDPKIGHCTLTKDFELFIIDRMLRFMVQQNAARSSDS
jgi:hypothetical protein